MSSSIRLSACASSYVPCMPYSPCLVLLCTIESGLAKESLFDFQDIQLIIDYKLLWNKNLIVLLVNTVCIP